MKISHIYKQYRIPSHLQMHMYRVTAVALSIAHNITVPVDREVITTACLLHDMGNIIKFDFDIFPEFSEPEGKAYWQNVKKEYIETYGTNECEATLMIGREIGVSDKVIDTIRHIGFKYAQQNSDSSNMERKVCTYADQRVAPFGIVSLEARLAEGYKRFTLHHTDNPSVFLTGTQFLKKIEKQIFDTCSIKPSDITDTAIEPLLEALYNTDV